MTVKHLFPESKPKLNLNFARSRSLDPRVSFTRASTGTYINKEGMLVTAVQHEPRFEYDYATGKSLGLLIEEKETNLATHSQEFDNASSWYLGTGLTPTTANTAEYAAPDGSNTAYRFTGDGVSNTVKYIKHKLDASADGRWTYSCFFKKGTNNFVQLAVGSILTCYANFDLNDGTKGDVGSDETLKADIQPLANGWYRCSISCKFQSNKNPGPVVALVSSKTAERVEKNSLSTYVYAWGLQAEFLGMNKNSVTPSSYFASAGTALERSTDLAQITGTNFSDWFNQRQSTLFVQMQIRQTGGYDVIWAFGGGGRRIEGLNGRAPWNGMIYFADGQSTKYIGDSGGAPLVRWSRNVMEKCAYSWNFDDRTGSVSLEGRRLLTEADGQNGAPLPTFPNGVTNFQLMGRNGALNNQGHVAHVAYYTRKLSDEQLEALTA